MGSFVGSRCPGWSVLLTPAGPLSPVPPRRSEGSGMERTEVLVWAPEPEGAPRWRQSSNWEEYPTLWAYKLWSFLFITTVCVCVCEALIILTCKLNVWVFFRRNKTSKLSKLRTESWENPSIKDRYNHSSVCVYNSGLRQGKQLCFYLLPHWIAGDWGWAARANWETGDEAGHGWCQFVDSQ